VLKRRGTFPHNLHGAPLLLPSHQCPIRPRLDTWFSQQGIAPQVVAEFDDGALMKSFGRQGHGFFTAPAVLETEICDHYAVKVVGRTTELFEEFFVISTQRRISHPCVVAMTTAAHQGLFDLD
jgi:LysR family transcriptional regulator, transcriptional activator of nhaA